MTQDEFNDRVMAHLEGPARAEAGKNLSDYLAGFSGRLFERLADTDPFRITANDLVAVTALSVEVPPEAAARILGPMQTDLSQLLRRIPAGASIADDRGLLGEHGAAWRLYDLLRSVDGLGPTTVSKLMAAKRPALIPIRDSVVSAALGDPDTWWALWEGLFVGDGADERVAHFEDVAASAGATSLSLLRVLDIVVWMANRAQR